VVVTELDVRSGDEEDSLLLAHTSIL
jgi:hypothetical protein